MAGDSINLYRNRDANDTTNVVEAWTGAYTLPSVDTLEWDNPGYVFTCWNDQQDGSGTEYAPGDHPPAHFMYAQWTEETYPAGYLDGAGLHRVWNKVKALVPTTTSQLTNDSGYITLNDLPIWDGGVT